MRKAACIAFTSRPILWVTGDLVNVCAAAEAVYLPEGLVSERGPQGLVAVDADHRAPVLAPY